MLLSLLGVGATGLTVHANYLYSFEPLVISCFEKREETVCKEALIQSELLQRMAGAQENYSCQTRLLGLGTDLIMIMGNKHLGEYSSTMIDEVKDFCIDL